MGLPKEIFLLRAMLHSAESNFRQFAAEYISEFETEFKNILGC
jgi:hypothetical protein